MLIQYSMVLEARLNPLQFVSMTQRSINHDLKENLSYLNVYVALMSISGLRFYILSVFFEKI